VQQYCIVWISRDT